MTKTQSNSTSSPPPILSPPPNNGNELSPGELTSPPSRDWQYTQAQLNDPQPVATAPIPGTAAAVTMNQFSNSMTLPAPPPPPQPPPPPHNSDTTMIYQLAQPADVIPTPSGGMMPHHLQPFPTDDYTWLFHGSSLFDLPPDDYLNLHFGGGLGPGSPTV